MEVYHDGALDAAWATVCDPYWSAEAARVVCRELGLPTSNARVASVGQFGEGEGDMYFNNLYCEGSESRLSECRYLEREYHNPTCSHGVGVICGGRWTYMYYVNTTMTKGLAYALDVLFLNYRACQ